MRIIGGTHRGTHLTEVGAGDAKAHLRPTSDRVRESLFNVLQGGRFGNPIAGAQVLDLFAGTGALGLESLSRGAAHVTAKLRHSSDCTLISTNATRLPTGKTCDLIFLDPPYGQGLGISALKSALSQGWVADGALIVWEESSAQPAPIGFQTLDSRKYGDTWVTFLTTAA